MKKEKEMLPTSKGKKTGPGSNPVNKFKKGKPTPAAAIDNIITGAVENVMPGASNRFANEGTVTSYDEER
ncbi:MAG: hypothetical protein ABIN97_12090 [Ginsengibacter sp.]